MERIAITGATGQLGRRVIQTLRAREQAGSIVALARSADKAQDLGVTVREADYEKPATLERALGGIDTLLLISSSEVGRRAAQHHNVITAARAAGVRRIVYTSLLHADTSVLDLAEEHRQTEAELRASGLAYVILRNGWYTENYTASLGGAIAGGAILGSAGAGKIASATRQDYAEAAVAVLTTRGHDGRTYELAGDTAYTLAELAAELSEQTGKAIAYHDLPEANYAEALVGFGIPEPFAKAIAGWDVAASRGALFDDRHMLSELIRRETTPLPVAVAEALEVLG